MVSEKAYITKTAILEGDVTIGDNVSVWYGAVLRGDLAPITVGENSNVQENAVIHVDRNYPVNIGKGVTIGHGAIIHGCTIGDDSLVGMGAIVLNGANIGKNCIIGAGALVTSNTIIPDNSLVIGSPGKVKRELTEEEIKSNKENAEEYVNLIPGNN